MINNIGKAMYALWFFFYAIVIIVEIMVLRSESLGERKMGMILGTGFLLLMGIVLFLSTIFIVKGKMRLGFVLSFAMALLLTYWFYISLLQNAAITS